MSVLADLHFVGIGSTCDLELPVGGVLDGADRKVKIGFDSNIHCYRCLI